MNSLDGAMQLDDVAPTGVVGLEEKRLVFDSFADLVKHLGGHKLEPQEPSVGEEEEGEEGEGEEEEEGALLTETDVFAIFAAVLVYVLEDSSSKYNDVNVFRDKEKSTLQDVWSKNVHSRMATMILEALRFPVKELQAVEWSQFNRVSNRQLFLVDDNFVDFENFQEFCTNCHLMLELYGQGHFGNCIRQLKSHLSLESKDGTLCAVALMPPRRKRQRLLHTKELQAFLHKFATMVNFIVEFSPRLGIKTDVQKANVLPVFHYICACQPAKARLYLQRYDWHRSAAETLTAFSHLVRTIDAQQNITTKNFSLMPKRFSTSFDDAAAHTLDDETLDANRVTDEYFALTRNKETMYSFGAWLVPLSQMARVGKDLGLESYTEFSDAYSIKYFNPAAPSLYELCPHCNSAVMSDGNVRYSPNSITIFVPVRRNVVQKVQSTFSELNGLKELLVDQFSGRSVPGFASNNEGYFYASFDPNSALFVAASMTRGSIGENDELDTNDIACYLSVVLQYANRIQHAEPMYRFADQAAHSFVRLSTDILTLDGFVLNAVCVSTRKM
jgi:hypothetical protein